MDVLLFFSFIIRLLPIYLSSENYLFEFKLAYFILYILIVLYVDSNPKVSQLFIPCKIIVFITVLVFVENRKE